MKGESNKNNDFLTKPNTSTMEKKLRWEKNINFNGPTNSRRCTDCLFLIIILLGWVVMSLLGLGSIGIISISGINKGNPERLLHGVDYKGNICGIDNDVQYYTKKWQPNLLGTNENSLGVSVSKNFGICVESCPDAGEERTDPYGTYGTWTAPLQTTDVLNFCVPLRLKLSDDFFIDTFGDFIRASKVIGLLGFLLSSFLSLFFLMVIRIPLFLRLIVWLCILIILLAFLSGGILMLRQGLRGNYVRASGSYQSDTQVWLLKGMGIFFLILSVLWLCTIIAVRKKIALSIGILRQAAYSLLQVPLLVLLPVLQSVSAASFTAIWLFYTVYLASASQVVVQEAATTSTGQTDINRFDSRTKKLVIYMVFIWFWTLAFINAFGQLASSHAVLKWYFRPPKTTIGSGQVFRSIGIVLRYHLGTAAFGSLIVALLSTIRTIVTYVKTKLTGTTNQVAVYLLSCIVFCLSCIECCVKYVNKHAFVQCACFGTGFCRSSYEAFGLIARNLGRLAVLSIIGDFVVFIGKLSISLTSAGIGYYYMTTYMQNDLSGYVMPTLLILLIAYVIASLFLEVLLTSANTILQAYVVDEEYCAGSHNEPAMKRLIEQQRNESQDTTASEKSVT